MAGSNANRSIYFWDKESDSPEKEYDENLDTLMDDNFAKSPFFNDDRSTEQSNSDTFKGNLIKQTCVWLCLKIYH